MSKNTKGKEGKDWAISIGLYTGILFGARSYHSKTHVQHVFYLPFIDFTIEIEK